MAKFFVWFETGYEGDHDLNDQRFLYRGYWWDQKLEMYHVRHRVYDPRRMIWLQRDPLGQLAGPDEYAYCDGEPRDYFDPMGLLPVYEPETHPDGTIIERPGRKDGKPGVHIYYYPEEFTWWGPDGPGYYPTPDPPRKVFVPDSTRDLDIMDDTGRTPTQRRQMRDLDAAASAGYVAVDNGYKATIFLVSLAIPGPDDILIAVAAKYGAKEIRLVAGQVRGIKDDGSEIVLDAADDAIVRGTPAFKKEQAAQKAAEDAKNASKGGQSPTKGNGCPDTIPKGVPGKDLPGKGEGWTKLKGDQGWRDIDGNTWKKDMKHKDHWDISDRKGNKIREVDFEGNELWPNGPKNKNK